nr:AAA family ATPase [Solimonas terrae]
MCIVGLAGIGKSALFRAMERLIGNDRTTQLDDAHDPLVIRGFISTTVVPGDSDRRLLARIAEQLDIEADARSHVERLMAQLKKIGYRDGVAGLNLDEFQHGTLSAANSRVTSLLLTARATGIPVAYACNFSLIHRLLERPQEDRDRLLARVTVLTPERPESEGWRLIVNGTGSVLRAYLRFDAESEAAELGRLSGCLPRNLHRLLGIAYEIARESASKAITMKHVRDAFHSRAFASARSDIQAIHEIADGAGWRSTRRLDLHCPEELRQDSAPKAGSATADQKLNVLTRHMLEKSMTAEERSGWRLAAEQRGKTDAVGKVVSIKKHKERTARSLIEAHNRFDGD